MPRKTEYVGTGPDNSAPKFDSHRQKAPLLLAQNENSSGLKI